MRVLCLAASALLVLCGCVRTGYIPLDPVAWRAPRAATCREGLRVYASREAVPPDARELAVVHGVGSVLSAAAVWPAVLDRAARLGATAVLYRRLGTEPGLVGGGDPVGEVVALWVPADTAAVRQRCAAALAREAERQRAADSARAVGRSPLAP